MKDSVSQQIKQYALSLGFDACGFCKAEPIEDIERLHLKTWLDNSYHAQMGYMANHYDKRCDPTLLVEGARSIISLALNYYPQEKQPADVPQFAYYAYGNDYHDVMKGKLQQLFDFIKTIFPQLDGRVFCDSAPVLERYWAAKSGLGFIGKNSLLIIPQKGSYYFLGELILNIDLEYDRPIARTCGSCTRCMDTCPTGAICEEKVIDANRCISYQTIENKGEICESVQQKLGNKIYGCDICQQVCPWNRFATAHKTIDFKPSTDFFTLTAERIAAMTKEDYLILFKKSAVKRAKYEGLRRNLKAMDNDGKRNEIGTSTKL